MNVPFITPRIPYMRGIQHSMRVAWSFGRLARTENRSEEVQCDKLRSKMMISRMLLIVTSKPYEINKLRLAYSLNGKAPKD